MQDNTKLDTTGLGYRLIDADNHYYEPYDCFTRRGVELHHRRDRPR